MPKRLEKALRSPKVMASTSYPHGFLFIDVPDEMEHVGRLGGQIGGSLCALRFVGSLLPSCQQEELESAV